MLDSELDVYCAVSDLVDALVETAVFFVGEQQQQQLETFNMNTIENDFAFS